MRRKGPHCPFKRAEVAAPEHGGLQGAPRGTGRRRPPDSQGQKGDEADPGLPEASSGQEKGSRPGQAGPALRWLGRLIRLRGMKGASFDASKKAAWRRGKRGGGLRPCPKAEICAEIGPGRSGRHRCLLCFSEAISCVPGRRLKFAAATSAPRYHSLCFLGSPPTTSPVAIP